MKCTGNDQTSQLVSAGTVVSNTTTTYGPDDRVLQSTDSFGRITQTLYDDYGRTKRTIAADGQITDIEYDELGNQSATIGHPVPAEISSVG